MELMVEEFILGTSKPWVVLDMSNMAEASGSAVPRPTFCADTAENPKRIRLNVRSCFIIRFIF
jgi:hypothetical protein